MKVTIFTDGGARGNPGPAGIGAVVKDEAGQHLGEVSEFIGNATNNVAEYRSLIEGLKLAINLQAQECDVYMDSQLVIKQMKGEYKVRDVKLKSFWNEAQELCKKLVHVTFNHVPRKMNQEADALVNQAIDLATAS